MNRHILTLCVMGCCFGTLSTDVFAQRGAQRGSSAAGAGQLAVTQVLQGLDANRNGMLDLTEANGRTREFVRRAGLDPNKTHAISAIARALSQKSAKDEKDKKSNGESGGSDKLRKVPGFGVEMDKVGVKDFSPSGEERMSPEAMKQKFGESVMSQVDRTITRYDGDKNGLIDLVEQKRTRWTNPTAEVSDTNKDGSLSRLELAYRYKKREDDSKKRIDSRSSSSRSKTFKTTIQNNPVSASRYSSQRDRINASSSSARGSRRTPSRPDRSSASKSRSSATAAKRFDSSSSDAYRKYAEGLFKNYDKDKDGKLSKKEMEEMRRPPKDADTNKDGYVSKSEMIAAVSKKSGGKSSSDSASKTSASSALDSKRRSASKSYNSADSVFGGMDRNNDGQLQMAEYTDAWTEQLVVEFREKDFNNDGVITVKEWRK